MIKVTPPIGLYVGFLNPKIDGRLLLRRREEKHSILPNTSFQGNWEVPGGALDDTHPVTDYNHLVSAAFAKAEERVGIQIPTQQQPFMGPFYTAFLETPLDLAGVVPFVTELPATKGVTVYVSPSELEALAVEFISKTEAEKQNLPEAKGLLSGKGKRMHLMALAALTHSPNPAFAQEARNMLLQYHK